MGTDSVAAPKFTRISSFPPILGVYTVARHCGAEIPSPSNRAQKPELYWHSWNFSSFSLLRITFQRNLELSHSGFFFSNELK